MTIDIKCSVCRNPDRRRIIELGWNGGMSAAAMARLFEDVAGGSIIKHLKEHADGDGHVRRVEVAPELPDRDRVLALRRMQLDEVDRQIAFAKQKADMLNAARDQRIADGVEGATETPDRDWSEFFNLLGKDGQSALGTIMKVTALEDKKAAKTADLKLGLFEAMSKAGLAPKAISGVKDVLALPSGTDDDSEDDPSA